MQDSEPHIVTRQEQPTVMLGARVGTEIEKIHHAVRDGITLCGANTKSGRAWTTWPFTGTTAITCGKCLRAYTAATSVQSPDTTSR